MQHTEETSVDILHLPLLKVTISSAVIMFDMYILRSQFIDSYLMSEVLIKYTQYFNEKDLKYPQ